MKLPWGRPGSLSLKLFVVLAVFVAAPTVLMVTISDFTLQTTINQQIGRAGIGKLQVAHGIEVLLGDLARNTCMRIAIDPELQALGRVGTFGRIVADGSTQFLFARYLDLLDDTVRTNPLFDSIDIVFEGADYVLDSESGTVLRSDFSDRQWLDAQQRDLGFQGVGTFLAPHRAGGLGNLVLSYYFPFPAYLTESQGAVVVNLREDEFSRLINDAGSAEGSVSLVDARGILVSHSRQELVGTPWLPAEAKTILATSQGVLTREGGGKLITWFRPDQGPWTYVGDFPLAALTRTLGEARQASVGMSLLVVLFGVALAFFLARRLFHPVRRLIREVEGRIGRQEDWQGNELGLLSGAFDILLKRETQLFQDLESQRARRDQEWAGRALRGELGGDESTVSPVLEGRYWLAGFLAIDHYVAFVNSFPPETREYLRSVVLHMAEQAFLPEVQCRGTVMDGRGVALVMCTDQSDGGTFADRIEEGFEELGSEAAKVLATSITLCLGTRGGQLDHLPTSWSEASALVRQRFLRGPGQWFWEENPAVSNPTPFVPRSVERALVASLEAQDPGGITRGLADLRLLLVSRRDLSFDNVQLILHQIIGALVTSLVENSIDLSRLFGPGVDLHRSLSEFETLEEALGWLESIVQGAVAGLHRNTDSEYVPAMVRYIRSHSHEDFGVEAVAQAAGLSYSHARKVFEDALGESIVEYTHALRIEEARTLLAGTGRTLNSIASAVGYNNVLSFHRQFKKVVGVTPGEFRTRSQGVRQI